MEDGRVTANEANNSLLMLVGLCVMLFSLKSSGKRRESRAFDQEL
jgi:hypothetical protein